MKYAIALAVLSFVVAAPVQADEAPASAPDLSCMVVMMNLSQSGDQRRQMEALIGSFYFIGRIDAAADSKTDLEKRVLDTTKAMTAEKFTAEASRCESQVHTRMQALSDMADELDKQLDSGKAAPPSAAK